MSIASIIPALTAAVEAEIELDLATSRRSLAINVAGDLAADRALADLKSAEAAADQAYTALSGAVADAPDSRAKAAITAGALRAVLRCLDNATVPLASAAVSPPLRPATDGIYDDCPKRLGWGDCCRGEIDDRRSCEWELDEDDGRAVTAPPPERPDEAETAVLRSGIDAASLAAFAIKERIEAGGLTPDQLDAAVAARDALDAAWDACTAYDLALDATSGQYTPTGPAAEEAG